MRVARRVLACTCDGLEDAELLRGDVADGSVECRCERRHGGRKWAPSTLFACMALAGSLKTTDLQGGTNPFWGLPAIV